MGPDGGSSRSVGAGQHQGLGGQPCQWNGSNGIARDEGRRRSAEADGRLPLTNLKRMAARVVVVEPMRAVAVMAGRGIDQLLAACIRCVDRTQWPSAAAAACWRLSCGVEWSGRTGPCEQPPSVICRTERGNQAQQQPRRDRPDASPVPAGSRSPSFSIAPPSRFICPEPMSSRSSKDAMPARSACRSPIGTRRMLPRWPATVQSCALTRRFPPIQPVRHCRLQSIATLARGGTCAGHAPAQQARFGTLVIFEESTQHSTYAQHADTPLRT